MPVPIGTGIAVSAAGLAGGAHPENIRLVVGDGESVAVRHPGRPQVHPAGVDLDNPATALANQMVMVHGIAEAEQRLAGFAPEHIHPAGIDSAWPKIVPCLQAGSGQPEPSPGPSALGALLTHFFAMQHFDNKYSISK